MRATGPVITGRKEHMKVYISKIHHTKYKYMLAWICDGYHFTDRFTSLKELNEYIANWDAEKIFVTDK